MLPGAAQDELVEIGRREAIARLLGAATDVDETQAAVVDVCLDLSSGDAETRGGLAHGQQTIGRPFPARPNRPLPRLPMGEDVGARGA